MVSNISKFHIYLHSFSKNSVDKINQFSYFYQKILKLPHIFPGLLNFFILFLLGISLVFTYAQETDDLLSINNKMISIEADMADINIINAQSYPAVGGNWTVRFNTTGAANLTITPVNGTEFERDLKFIELKCGNDIIDAQYYEEKVFYPDWNCSEEGKEISKVLLPGKHILEFSFGNEKAYAYNTAGNDTCDSGDNVTTC